MKEPFLIFILLLCSFRLFCHNSSFEVMPPDSITIKTFYDTGEPMDSARVKVFTPENYEKQAYELITDEHGIFSFVPETPGLWIFQVLDKSGHGQRINLDVSEQMLINTGNESNFSLVQRIIMGLAVLWGFIGTALYFLRKRGQK